MSLATRLSAFFLAAAAVLLGGFDAAIFLLAQAHYYRVMDEGLGTALGEVGEATRIESGRAVWEPERARPTINARPLHQEVRWAIFDGGGALVDRSWELERRDLALVPHEVPPRGHDHRSFADREGRRWRVAVRRLPRTRPEGTPDSATIIQATAAPLAPVEAILRTVGLVLIGLSSGLWLLAALSARIVCRGALRPVTRMAATAQAMSAADRGQHLPSPGTRDELDDLAGAFNGLLDRLHEALERQKRFAGDASHQLRTPLTALVGEIEVARRRDRSPQEYRQVLDELHGEAVRLKQIVESLLFLARAEADAAHPESAPIDLGDWLPDYLRRWEAHERACDIREEVPPGLSARVRVCPPLLGQLLDNLLENACKYSAPGTPVVVRLAREPGAVALVVEDRGIGLSAEVLPHVFEPFYRGEQARLRGEPGVGLGLAVVQRIATTFGGSVEVQSQPDRGCRFLVRFPEATPRAEAPTPPVAVEVG